MEIDKLQRALKMACLDFDVRVPVQVVDFEKGHRVIVTYEAQPGNGDFPRHMIQIERRMKEILGMKMLDLRLPEKVDNNKREIRTDRA